MKKLPLGLQNFQNIIEKDFLYVDKTRQIHQFITESGLYFLSRPRRFGKSLLISTLDYIFKGRKDLFKGLYIYEKTDWDWQHSPVLKFNFASFGKMAEGLDSRIQDKLKEHADNFGIVLPEKNTAAQFEYLVTQLSKQQGKVVILIDEYDKPIIDFLDDIPTADRNREILKSFYAPLKDLESEGRLRLLFITGVSKFSKVSIFSDLNNLKDLTLSNYAVDLFGITNQEIQRYFAAHIKRSSQALEMSETTLLDQLNHWYDGYSWDAKTFVYNPFSILNFFDESSFANYWFTTGTPTFLVRAIRDQGLPVKNLETYEVTESFFEKFEIKNPDIYSLLFQTGYLTIKGVKTKRNRAIYTLGYPNHEVKESFVNNLLEAYTYQQPTIISIVLWKIEESLFDYDLPLFIEQLKILFSNIAHQLLPKDKKDPTEEEATENFAAWEGYFHTVIYLVLSFLGLNVRSEVSRHTGRLDAVLETDDHLYLMEFKLDGSGAAAIDQIKEREYASGYLNTSKKVVLVGIAFDKKKRNVKDWVAEEWTVQQ